MSPHPVPGCGVAVMAKASAAGRTKTRMCPPLTLEEAAAFNTAFLCDVAANLLAAGDGIGGAMAFGPPGGEAFFREILPPGIQAFECWLPNFGDCLFDAARTLFKAGHEAACVLNADSPTLPTAILTRAAELLAEPGDRAVLGPSTDGGYYLLGLKAPHRRLFDDIRWSSEHVADETRARAREIGLVLHELPVWYDVDDADALRLLHGELFEARPFGGSGLAPAPAEHTRLLLRRLLAEAGLGERLGLAETLP